MVKKLSALVLGMILFLILLASVRGLVGNPISKELSTVKWKEDGPFELSPERGRYSLLYSLIEDKSFFFSLDIAKFAIPDLGYKDGHFVSLFAPAVSFIVMPGYILGKTLQASQAGAYSIVALFAITNLFLVKTISKKIGANELASWLGGILFLFATPAYAYAVNLYQHHISTFLILLASLIVISSKKIWPLFFVFFLCAMSIPVDYPNLFLMFPIGIAAIFKIFEVDKQKESLKINVKIVNALTLLGLVLPLIFFLWFNAKSYGNPLQFSGTIGSVREIDNSGKPAVPKTANPEDVEGYLHPETQSKSAVSFFESRDLLNGFYLHFTSPDRGIVIFAPAVLVGIIGIFFLHKNRNKHLAMLMGVIAANILLYSMWGDPWGGWAFGSRYLIPTYSIMGIFAAIAITKLNKKILFLVIFWGFTIYSIGVNTLGAITTSANPPQVEALPLEKISGKQERYSYDRNWEFLKSGKSKSFVFQTYAKKYVTSVQYFYILAGSIGVIATGLTVALFFQKKGTND